MGNISTWSPVDANNNQSPPDGWPEGQAPSTVNNCARADKGAIRRWYEDAQWLDYGFSVSRTGASTFDVLSATSTATAWYTEGRRIRFEETGGLEGYGAVLTASASGTKTHVTLYLDSSASLTSSLSAVDVGIINPRNTASTTYYELIETKTASSDSSIDFTDIPIGNYNSFELRVVNAIPASDGVNFWFRTSSGTGGSPSFDAGASDYAYGGLIVGEAGSVSGFGSSGTFALNITDSVGVGSASNEGISFILNIPDPSNSALHGRLWGQGNYLGTSSNVVYTSFGGVRQTAAVIRAIRCMFASGNIASGSFSLYGIRSV